MIQNKILCPIVLASALLSGCGGTEAQAEAPQPYGSIGCVDEGDCVAGELCVLSNGGKGASGLCYQLCNVNQNPDEPIVSCDAHPGTDCTHLIWSYEPTWNVCLPLD